MNNETLNNVFTDTANSIRTKLGTSGGIKPENFATNINNIPGPNGIYKVSTIQERNNLNASDGDICLVYDTPFIPVTNTSTFQKFTFNNTLTIDESLSPLYQDTDYSIDFRGGDYMTTGECQLGIWVSKTELAISAYFMGPESDVDGAYIHYTSSDSLTYTLESVSGEWYDESSKIVSLPVEVTCPYYDPKWFPLAPLLLNIQSISFNIYQYLNSSWNYLDIGLQAASEDYIIDKKGYTSSGIITGTKNMDRYVELKYLISDTAPENTSLLWLKLKQSKYYNTEPWKSYINDFNSSGLKDNYTYGKRISISPIDATPLNNMVSISTVNTLSSAGYLIQNGRNLYFTDNGGHFLKYDIMTGQLLSTIDLPTANYMNMAWGYDLENKYIYFLEGVAKGAAYNTPTGKKFYKFDTNTDQFSTLTDLPEQRYKNLSASIYVNNMSNGLCVHYYNTSQSHKSRYYNLSTNTWTEKSSSLIYDSLPIKKVKLSNGVWYGIIGGHSESSVIIRETSSQDAPTKTNTNMELGNNKLARYTHYGSTTILGNFDGGILCSSQDGILYTIVLGESTISQNNEIIVKSGKSYPYPSYFYGYMTAFYQDGDDLYFFFKDNKYSYGRFTKIADFSTLDTGVAARQLTFVYSSVPCNKNISGYSPYGNLPMILKDVYIPYIDYITAPNETAVYTSEKDIISQVLAYNESTSQWEVIIDHTNN